jgi:hypothetical protein
MQPSAIKPEAFSAGGVLDAAELIEEPIAD